MRRNGIIIAIDGPAGVGKSTIGRMVAERINYKFISSGKMYRAVAWLCVNNKVDLSNEEEVLKIAMQSVMKFVENKTPEPSLSINGHILEKELFDEEIAAATSLVARLMNLRKYLVKLQREIGKDGGIIMEGRDITTNVFPDAELKIYLDASAEARANRRVKQLKEQGISADYNEILDMIKKRDAQDSSRKHNPLMKSHDSFYIDSTNLFKEEVVDKILNLYKETMEAKN